MKMAINYLKKLLCTLLLEPTRFLKLLGKFYSYYNLLSCYSILHVSFSLIIKFKTITLRTPVPLFPVAYIHICVFVFECLCVFVCKCMCLCKGASIVLARYKRLILECYQNCIYYLSYCCWCCWVCFLMRVGAFVMVGWSVSFFFHFSCFAVIFVAAVCDTTLFA